VIPLRWRGPARAAWLVVVGLTLAAYLAGMVARVQDYRQACVQPEAVCHEPSAWRPTLADEAALRAAGWSLDGFAMLELGKWIVFSGLWMVVGGLIFARKSD
jgi:hypothetical protein